MRAVRVQKVRTSVHVQYNMCDDIGGGARECSSAIYSLVEESEFSDQYLRVTFFFLVNL